MKDTGIQEVPEFLTHMEQEDAAERSVEATVHKDFEKQIPAFLSDMLPNRELDRFLSHLSGCSACEDELSIQYLVYAGMPKLETGETFNLQKELADYVELETQRLHRRRELGAAAVLLEAAAILATAVAFLLLL